MWLAFSFAYLYYVSTTGFFLTSFDFSTVEVFVNDFTDFVTSVAFIAFARTLFLDFTYDRVVSMVDSNLNRDVVGLVNFFVSWKDSFKVRYAHLLSFAKIWDIIQNANSQAGKNTGYWPTYQHLVDHHDVNIAEVDRSVEDEDLVHRHFVFEFLIFSNGFGYYGKNIYLVFHQNFYYLSLWTF